VDSHNCAEKGMGLGLSICHSIDEKHGGLINVKSKPGQGTTFYIYLPTSEKEIPEWSIERSQCLKNL